MSDISADIFLWFGCCISYHMGLWGCWSPSPYDIGHDWYPKDTPSPAEFGHCTSHSVSVCTDIYRKIRAPQFQPFKIIQGHWNWHGLIWIDWLQRFPDPLAGERLAVYGPSGSLCSLSLCCLFSTGVTTFKIKYILYMFHYFHKSNWQCYGTRNTFNSCSIHFQIV